jgi:dTDP-4-dehydrorhamnose 3,5-epimerase
MAMRIEPGPLDGLFLIELDVHGAVERPGGSSREGFRAAALAAPGPPPFAPIQWNISESTEGTLRGFHGEPWSKLVHAASGRVFAAIADIRSDSPTSGRVWTGEIDRGKALFVGAGLANGFQALTPIAVYAYLVDRRWSPGIVYPAVAWDDPDLAVAWPITDERLAISAKDRQNPTLRAFWG